MIHVTEEKEAPRRLAMATFLRRCNMKKFLFIAAAGSLSFISAIHFEKLANAVAAPPSISLTAQPQERDTPTQPALQVPRDNTSCPHKIDSQDVHGPDKDWHIGGWAVRQLCSQPLDTLVFVHAAPSHWENRAHMRATLFEEAARAAFNWTGVFFVAQHKDPLVNLGRSSRPNSRVTSSYFLTMIPSPASSTSSSVACGG
ncbi:hypothetical protein HPB51_021366 [Rhipicephalus microplus]|uniref:Uncharacterized protein n=1 Tax=Rhipicephalus microplus TaxID=6941 RepID=A0A9J6F673_RHIMP|nr:hypothetical protein HPB51_021366 [Rhipicephalus microplus]